MEQTSDVHATVPVHEVPFPWFLRHASFRNREVFEWEDYYGPRIVGTEWKARKDMLRFYAERKGREYGPPDRENFRGFVRNVMGTPSRGFASWEVALEWIRTGGVG